MRIAPFFPLLLSLFTILGLLQGCTSNAVSRDAAHQMDVGYNNANALVDGVANGNIADTYDSTSQTAKGVVFGGVAGAAIGSATNGVGLLPGLAVGAIVGGAYGAYLDGYTSTRDTLENRGVKVIVLGDQVMLVIRSNRLFEGLTSRVRPTAYSTLNLISKFISVYPNMMVKVSGYTSAMLPQTVSKSLSQQQAEAVAKYLWKTGINTRMLYAEGYGGCKLVLPNSYAENNDNYRIEITLEKLPA